MGATNPTRRMTKYQFQIDDDKWEKWKLTVPRNKSLEQRIIELIEADTNGRIQEPGEDEPMDIADRVNAAIDEGDNE